MKDLTPKYVMGMAIFLFILITFASGIFGSIVAFYTENAATAIVCSILFCDIILVILYNNMLNRCGLNRIYKPRLRSLKILLKGILAIYLFDLAFTSTLSLFSVDTTDLEYWNVVYNNANILVYVIATVIVAPIFEELLFRGIIYGGVKYYKGERWAFIISSLAFGVAHGLGLYTVVGFVCGLILAYVYEGTGTLLIPIVMHTLVNMLALMEKMFSIENPLTYFDSNSAEPICIIIAFIVSIVLTVMLAKEPRCIDV